LLAKAVVATVREPLLVLDDHNKCGAPIIAVVVSSGLLHPEFLEPSTDSPRQFGLIFFCGRTLL
jgi:hypothetical protein